MDSCSENTTKCDSGEEKKKKKRKCGPPKRKPTKIALNFDVPYLLRTTGPKQIEAAKGFIPTLIYFSIASALGTLYFTDWKAVLKYVPYYGGKFPPDPVPDDKDD